MDRTDGVVPKQQRWFADRYAENARFVSDLAEPLIDILNPKAGELILDLGCGDGALTKLASNTGAITIGADASLDQVAATRNLGIPGAVVDGHNLAFKEVFDAILTNAALHWMTRPDEVIQGMWNALKPGGRLVGEMGGMGNIAKITHALTEALARRRLDDQIQFPWYFPDENDYRKRLENQGFDVNYIELIPRPTPLPGEFTAWLDTFGEHFVFLVPDSERDDFKEEVAEALRQDLYEPHDKWVADYVRLRFSATRPAKP
ncbi:MAG: SAM-dependent methyltransferase [Rhodospirillaceae bacterium]|nr:SAM-dependent methyltransferase [Rhodospirillaceae bacterium]|tara:strand:+ start:16156 stop:16938 length:783 start_codon:yes stop_codon:yes gene_type:complete